MPIHPLRAVPEARLKGATVISAENSNPAPPAVPCSTTRRPSPHQRRAVDGGDMFGVVGDAHICPPPLTVSACCFLCRVSVSAFGAMLPVPAASLSSLPFHSSGGVPAAC